jgi:hypothetical protein
VKARKDVRLLHVRNDNRDGLPQELEAWLRHRLACQASHHESSR